jgi:hypothetical protein
MTTVGYGDAYPVTWLGKIVAGFTMLSGILVLAFPISILGSNFSDIWKETQRESQEIERAKQMHKTGNVCLQFMVTQ